ncbi:MAG: arginine--tRNA ligase [Planctomycetota bacterium]
MSFVELLQGRLHDALDGWVDGGDRFASMVRPTTDAANGDYQINAAMPLSKLLREKDAKVTAAALVERLQWQDVFETPEIAGPGFVNLKLRNEVLGKEICKRVIDTRLGVAEVAAKQTIVIDYSSPNVAKPMHVGHIRSTVIGDALARTLRFLGYDVITDNHLGDWGTQFGMIIYGYKHFGDPATVEANPVTELSGLYRLVHAIMGYHKSVARLPTLKTEVDVLNQRIETLTAELTGLEGKPLKKAKKSLVATERKLDSLQKEIVSLEKSLAARRSDTNRIRQADAHADISKRVLEETAKLHAGDPTNRGLWEKFLPHCRKEIDQIYARLNIQFDHTLGESFYHDRLADVVTRLKDRGLATTSDGAVCVFLDGFDAPMIVQKQDGAFLYATTDLATFDYRIETFDPSEILYVVDTRQSEHFDKLFAVAAKLSDHPVRLVHVNFGTVLGKDGRPMKTRDGDLIRLETLLEGAVDRARDVVCNPERLQTFDPPMNVDEQQAVAEAVGLGAVKFADLSHERTSDYRFDLEKMISLEGGSCTYVQYQYARTQSLLARGGFTMTQIQERVAAESDTASVHLDHPLQRALALQLCRFEDALVAMKESYGPNVLADYLLETARIYAKFNQQCPVLKAETEALKHERLVLVVMTARLLECGLGLLGIDVIARM